MKHNCNWCNIEFDLTDNQIKQLNKDSNKPLFCCRQCSGKYYAKKSHEGKTSEDIKNRNLKISNTLKQRERNMTDEERQHKYDRLNSFWKELDDEQRTQRNKASSVISKQTKLERYGDSTFNNRDKAKQTMKDRYGVTNAYQTNKAKQNAESVMMERYNVRKFFSNRDAFEKVSLKKYNVIHPMKAQSIKNKLSNTKYLRYGNENYNNPNKSIETFINRYGVRRPMMLQINVEKCKNTKLKRYGDENFNNRPKALKTLYKKYGKNYYEKLAINSLGNRISNVNKKFAEYIGSNDFEFPIQRHSYDVKYNNYLIEIDPSFTHNCLENGIYNKFGGLPKEYHYNKSKLASDNGYRCIHVFDWDDWDKIKYMLQDKQILYARKLHIKEVNKKECDDFLNNYHIQNTCKGQEIRLGLYSGNELVEIMTFGKPRYNKNYQYELLRLCTMCKYNVVGGAERLFKHFISNYKPQSIISYCDYGKFSGDVYTRLGFTKQPHISFNKHWSKGSEHITDNLLRQRGYDQLFKTNYGKGSSNEQLMLNNGWLPIYDAGQLTYVWNNN